MTAPTPRLPIAGVPGVSRVDSGGDLTPGRLGLLTRSAPWAAGALGLAGAAAIASSHIGWVPACPLHQATGIWCPGCGLTRGLVALGHGHLMTALHDNALLPLVLVLAAAAWWAWVGSTIGRPAPAIFRRTPRTAWAGLVVVIAVFTVVRNLPGGAFLAP